jgi:hypothetical protein
MRTYHCQHVTKLAQDSITAPTFLRVTGFVQSQGRLTYIRPTQSHKQFLGTRYSDENVVVTWLAVTFRIWIILVSNLEL